MIRSFLAHLREPALGFSLALAAASADGADLTEPRAFAGLIGVTHAEFNHDSSRVLVRTRQPAIGLWDAASGKAIDGELQPGAAVCAHFLSPDHRTVLVGFSESGSRVFDTTTGNALTPPLDAAFEEAEAPRAAFSPDGKLVVILEAEFASVFQIPGGRRVAKLSSRIPSGDEEPDMNAAAAFTADGAQCFLLTGRSVTRYDTATWKPVGKALRHPAAESAYHIGFIISTDSRWMATFDDPGENGPQGHLQAWDLAKGTPLGKPLVAVNGLEGRFMAPGNRLLVLPGRGEASVRELPAVKTLSTIRKHDDVEGPNAAASPDGKWLISWGSDRELRLIEPASGKVVDRFSSGAAISQVLLLPDSTGALVVFDNSSFLLQNHYDHYLVRFAFPEMRITHSARTTQPVVAANLSPDGRALALVAGRTDHEQLWLYDTSSLQPKP